MAAQETLPLGEVQETVQALGDYEAGRGNLSRALSVYKELLENIQSARSGLPLSLRDAVNLSKIYSAAAGIYRRSGQADAGAPWRPAGAIYGGSGIVRFPTTLLSTVRSRHRVTRELRATTFPANFLFQSRFPK
jgi:hypothetical protein